MLKSATSFLIVVKCTDTLFFLKLKALLMMKLLWFCWFHKSKLATLWLLFWRIPEQRAGAFPHFTETWIQCWFVGKEHKLLADSVWNHLQKPQTLSSLFYWNRRMFGQNIFNLQSGDKSRRDCLWLHTCKQTLFSTNSADLLFLTSRTDDDKEN